MLIARLPLLGHSVLVAKNVEEAKELVENQNPDFIMMGESQINDYPKPLPQSTVGFVEHFDKEKATIRLLGMGVDEVVVIPVNLEVLSARMNAIVRRRDALNNPPD